MLDLEPIIPLDQISIAIAKDGQDLSRLFTQIELAVLESSAKDAAAIAAAQSAIAEAIADCDRILEKWQ